MKVKGEKRKFSWAFIVSVAVHAAVAVYLAKLALDKVVPEGEVISYDINYTMPKGEQFKATEIDVVEKPKVPEVAKAPPKELPVKEVKKPAPPPPPPAVSKSEAIDQQGDVPTEIKKEEIAKDDVPAPGPEVTPEVKAEEYTQTPEEEKLQETPAPVEEKPTLAEKVQEPADTAGKPAEEIAPIEQAGQNPTQTENYGSPEGTVIPESAARPMPGNKPPAYPYWSKLRHQEGTAVAHIFIDAEGIVTDVKFIKSSGFPFLDNAVVKAVKNWRYYPGKARIAERPFTFRLTQPATTAPGQLRTTN